MLEEELEKESIGEKVGVVLEELKGTVDGRRREGLVRALKR